MQDELYLHVFTGGPFATALMCRRCGALVAAVVDRLVEPDEVTPRMAHDAFHAAVQAIVTGVAQSN